MDQPYTRIALISAESGGHGEIELLQAIVNKAQTLGADAVVVIGRNKRIVGEQVGSLGSLQEILTMKAAAVVFHANDK